MNRPIYLLAGILILGLAAYMLISQDSHRIESKAKFIELDTTKVDFIHVVNRDGDLTMQKVGAHWRITNPIDFPANETYVSSLIDKAASLETESLITRNKSKFDQYDLGDSAIYVEIGVMGGLINKFYSGKPSDTYTHTYMRKEGSDEVWLVSGTPKSSFSRRPNDWRDKSVLDLDRTLMQKIILKFPNETIELNREISKQSDDTTLTASDTSWMATAPKVGTFKVDKKPLNRIMNTVSRMNSIDFKDAGKDTMPDFSKPEFGIELFLEGSQHEKLDFVAEEGDGSRWYAQKNDDPSTIFVLYQSSVKNLMKRAPELESGEAPKNDNDKK